MYCYSVYAGELVYNYALINCCLRINEHRGNPSFQYRPITTIWQALVGRGELNEFFKRDFLQDFLLCQNYVTRKHLYSHTIVWVHVCLHVNKIKGTFGLINHRCYTIIHAITRRFTQAQAQI